MSNQNPSAALPAPFKMSWVVKNLEEATEKFSKVLGLPAWDLFDYSADEKDISVGGAFTIRVAWSHLEGMTYELIQPVTEGSVWADFLAQHGEGMHLTAYSVPETWSDLVSAFGARGATTLLSAVFDGNRWCYLDVGAGNCRIELTEER